jgi:hypothetical protein
VAAAAGAGLGAGRGGATSGRAIAGGGSRATEGLHDMKLGEKESGEGSGKRRPNVRVLLTPAGVAPGAATDQATGFLFGS